MKLIFSSKKIAALENFDVQSRLAVIHLAKGLYTPFEKFIINLLKLLVLIPPFIFIARLDGWLILLPAISLLLGYFFILQPLTLLFVDNHIDKAIKKYEAIKKGA